MKKISEPHVRHNTSRSTNRPLSPFERIPRASEDRHPVDIAVDKRTNDDLRRKWILKHQSRLLSALGERSDLYLKLESMVNERHREREKCYFNLGYEHGSVEPRAAVAIGFTQLSQEAEQLAKGIRELLLQASLPAFEAMLVLLQCTWVLVDAQRID